MKFKKIYVEITNRCNLHCPFCAGNLRKEREMSIAEFQHVLSEIKPYTDYLYLHVLGEPLCHSQFSALLKEAKAKGFLVNITSNGTLLAQYASHMMGHVRQLNLSLHSFDQNSQAHRHSYLQDCLFYGDELARHGTYISYRFWNRNNGQMADPYQTMIQTMEKHYGVSIGDEAKQKLALRTYVHFEEPFVWPSMTALIHDQSGTCYGLRSHCAILCDGSVVPCCLDSAGVITLGNIFTTSFQAIMESKRTQTIIQGFQNGKIQEPLCQRCTYRQRFHQEDL